MTQLIADLFQNAPKADIPDFSVSGWVRTVRDSKAFGFIEINDGTSFKNLQLVLEDGKTENFAEALKITLGSAIRATGTLTLTPGMKQPFELKTKTVEVIGACDPAYPLQKKRHSFEYLRTIAHLRPRANTYYAVFRIRSLAAQLIHQFFREHGFVYVHTPIITASDCEGAGEMFQVTTLDIDHPPKTERGTVDYTQDFFKKQANLTVSGQLNVETFCLAFRNVYTFGPTFRAEISYTQRHAAEFWMIEPEIAFADLFDDMRLAEEMIKYVISHVIEQVPDEMDFLNSFVEKGLIDKLTALVDSEFVRCTYTDAIEILTKSGAEFEYPVSWGVDLQTEHERYLTEKHFGKPVFVYNYPREIKAFYMRLNDDNKTVAAVDMLVPGVGELIGGSQREEREDVLKQRIAEYKLDEAAYDWYLDTRRFGTAPHAGFGLGFERLIMYLTGMSNIRDVLPFPRTTGNAEF
ncbi:MAG: asparagine--tRNA ligase [Clostridiales bacterium]|nr:asparagine--tRNA ligase [Clostridiales bacterium]